jgi:hypothetical protein
MVSRLSLDTFRFLWGLCILTADFCTRERSEALLVDAWGLDSGRRNLEQGQEDLQSCV